jgi:hypothetical protein
MEKERGGPGKSVNRTLQWYIERGIPFVTPEKQKSAQRFEFGFVNGTAALMIRQACRHAAGQFGCTHRITSFALGFFVGGYH